MSGDEEQGQVMVPNPYLAALRDNRTDAMEPVRELRTSLDDAVAAMDAGAWFSTTADTFYAELTGRQQRLATVRDEALGEFDDAMAGMPEMVDSESWYVRWRNLGNR